MSETTTRKALARFCHLLYERHLVTGVAGNVSVRLKDKFLVTPSGFSLRDVTEKTIVSVGRKTPHAGPLRPSKEFIMHLGIYQQQTDVDVVCHIHGACIVAASALFPPGPTSLPPLTPGHVFFAHPLPLLPFLLPGSRELADATSQAFSDKKLRALLLQNHGLVTVGKTMEEALNIAEEIDECAMVFVLTHGRAKEIPPSFFHGIQKG